MFGIGIPLFEQVAEALRLRHLIRGHLLDAPLRNRQFRRQCGDLLPRLDQLL